MRYRNLQKMVSGLFSVFFSICFFSALAQSAGPVKVGPEVEKKILLNVAKEIRQLQLETKGENDELVQFRTDTLRIESYKRQYMQYDYSSAGMRYAAADAAEKYDKLLNKYYQKLLGRLKPSDRPVLIQAEKAWLAFRDKEMALQGILRKDEYSGGGTIQQLIASGFYLDLVKQRAVRIFEFYSSALSK